MLSLVDKKIVLCIDLSSSKISFIYNNSYTPYMHQFVDQVNDTTYVIHDMSCDIIYCISWFH